MTNLANLVAYIEGLGGYDLHERDLGPLTIATWEAFPVRKYSYVKTEPDGTLKRGLVALLDPSSEQIARWILSAIEASLGQYDESAGRALAKLCLEASGFQFLVRGVHWEDMTPPFTAYTFFDGVTVTLRGWDPAWPTTPLDDATLEQALRAGAEDVGEVKKYARIQSTERADYLANGGSRDVSGNNWLDVVRDCYQAAWGKDSNELMTAKARAEFPG
jgi:hypothetical protein